LVPGLEVSLHRGLEVIEIDVHVERDVAPGDRIVAKALLGFLNVPLEGSFFDLPAGAEPQRLMGVVLLRDHLKAKTQRRVSDLLASQHLEATIDVFARNRGLDLFEAEEVLIVQVAQAVDAGLELAHEDLNVLRFQRHGGGTFEIMTRPAKRGNGQQIPRAICLGGGAECRQKRPVPVLWGMRENWLDCVLRGGVGLDRMRAPGKQRWQRRRGSPSCGCGKHRAPLGEHHDGRLRR